MEIFKESKKSLCNSCFNVNEKCTFIQGKMCETDPKIGKAYVSKCNWHNKEIKSEYKSNTVKADASAESRIDMMGGGHNLKELSGDL